MLRHTAAVDPLAADFAAFVDRRDTAALARVFDATAGRLLLVAAHVAGRNGNAEDLVQATFVHAMERAAQWDRSRSPWPWLVGILQHEIRMAWRRQQRRREVGGDAAAAADGTAADAAGTATATAATAATSDPFARAASAEVVDTVTRAIDALPLAVRQVLRLRLVHGLSPVEIARALELPAGTVRVRLHRGRQALQRALPAGIAGAVALVLGAENALLAQVRDAVLARAGAGLAAATAATTTAASTAATALVAGAGWMTTKKIAFAAAAALVAGLGTLLVLPARAAPVPVARAARVEGAAAAMTQLPRSTPAADANDAATGAADRRVAEAPEGAWLRVRVVDTDDRPIPGADVALRVAPVGVGFESRTIATATTDGEGAARLSRDALRGHSELHYRTSRYEVRASARGHAFSSQQIAAAPRGGRDAELRFELRAVVALAGRVVDAFGTPVAGAALALGGLPGFSGWTRQGVRTADDGTFELPLQGHDVRARVLAARHEAHGEGRCELPLLDAVPPGTSFDVGTIVLCAADVVRGCVVLGDGSPLAEYPLRVDRSGPRGAIPHRGVRTDAAGRFAIAVGDGEQLRSIAIDDRTGAECARAMVSPGGGEIRLVVDRQLLVLDARDPSGEPVPGTRVLVQGFDLAPGRGAFEACRRPANSGWYPPRDAAGRHLVLSPFGWGWVAGASDENVVPVTWRHEAERGTSRVEHTLVVQPEDRFGSLVVTACDDAGAPVARFRADVCHGERDDHREIDAEAGRVAVEAIPAGPLRVVLEVPFGERTPLGHLTSQFGIDVHVRAGERSEVRFAVPPHGRVAFRLHDPLQPEQQFMDPEILADGAGETGPVIIRSAGRAARDTIRLLGQPFAPGAHTFVIEAEGFCRATRTVHVVAGEVAIVDVPLVALAPR